MNLQELLSKTKVDPAFLSRMADLDHQWIVRVNDLLSSLPNFQLDILVENISPITDIDQMYDKLSEIVVASLFIKEKPHFFKDNEGKPDILLTTSGQYIEVKRLNNSDYEKWKLDGLAKSDYMTGSRKVSSDEKQIYPIDKSISLFNDALSKFKRSNLTDGTIYLLYTLDKIGQIQNWAEIEKNFVEKLLQSWNRLPATTISLNVHNENELFNR